MQSERNEIVDRGNEDRGINRENKTEGRERKKERGLKTEKGSASLLL